MYPDAEQELRYPLRNDGYARLDPLEWLGIAVAVVSFTLIYLRTRTAGVYQLYFPGGSLPFMNAVGGVSRINEYQAISSMKSGGKV